MATWQFSVRLIPRSTLVARFGEVPKSISKEQFDTLNWWAQFPSADSLVADLDEVAPRRDVWSPGMEGWGVEDGNRLDVWREDGHVAEVFVRFDVRDPREFMHKVARLALKYDLVGVTDDYDVREMSVPQLAALALTSPARRFLDDPEGFVKRINIKDGLNLE